MSIDQTILDTTNPVAGLLADGGSAISGATNAVNSVSDFVQWVAWIFHPLNILRAVEFLSGSILLGIGLWSVLNNRSTVSNDSIARVSRQLVAATPIGTRHRMATGRRQGRYEGETEYARNEGRRERKTELTAEAAKRRQTRGSNRSRRVRSAH